MTVWDDINRMRTLNTTQSQRRQNLHVCPLQIDIVQRLIERYSNEGELLPDPKLSAEREYQLLQIPLGDGRFELVSTSLVEIEYY